MLNALALWAAWRAARRINPDRLDAAGDALLLFYLVQYLSVCIPGLIGALHALSIGAVALLLSGALGAIGWLRRSNSPSPPIAIGGISLIELAASSLFVFGYVATLVWHQRPLPVISNDAITYHLPAAVQWLQTGKLGLYEAWFYNPANSYSPLAGSTFIAWLIAPFGNDVVARFVQLGPLMVLFVAMINLSRRMGTSIALAALVAAAAVLARPLVSQTILAKDDLFVAAFFVLAIDALSRARLEQRAGPWRAGIAIGLLLATKFTVLLSLPILLLMLGRGWNWRRIAIIAACAMLLAGPWYLRNALLTGNPIYPSRIGHWLPGMLNVHRSDLLATPAGVWQVFTDGYYSIPPILAAVMIAGWMAAAGVLRREVFRDRLARTCIVGSALGVALFVALAPYGEMRFAYPAILLIFAAGAIAVARIRFQWLQLLIAAAVLLVSAMTAFIQQRSATFTITAAAIAAAGAIPVFLHIRGVRIRGAMIGLGVFAIAGLAMYAFVHWKAYVRQCRADAAVAWSDEGVYGDIGRVWAFVRDEIPAGSTIAYSNTYFTYPLMGYSYDHRLVYVPTRHDLERFVDMPPIEHPMSGEEIVGNLVAMLRENADREQWLRRLRASGAEYLIVSKRLKEAGEASPVELEYLSRTTPMFENEAGAVFRIN